MVSDGSTSICWSDLKGGVPVTEEKGMTDDKKAVIFGLIGVGIALVGFLLVDCGVSGRSGLLEIIFEGEFCGTEYCSRRALCIPYRFLLIVAVGFWLWATYLKFVRSK
jgi:hypothetical protein